MLFYGSVRHVPEGIHRVRPNLGDSSGQHRLRKPTLGRRNCVWQRSTPCSCYSGRSCRHIRAGRDNTGSTDHHTFMHARHRTNGKTPFNHNHILNRHRTNRKTLLTRNHILIRHRTNRTMLNKIVITY